jgi:hypothetical protein
LKLPEKLWDIGVDCAYLLFSTIISKGTFNKETIFKDSYKTPWPKVPSPTKIVAILFESLIFSAKATPAATGNMFPCTPLL